LVEVARISTHRRRVQLTDAQGRPLAELDDDQVTGSSTLVTKTRFREIEVELAEGAPATVLNALVEGLHTAGAHPAPSMSKVARVLGEPAQRPPDVAPAPLPHDATARDLVRTTMLGSVTELLERDPQLRLSDDVEAVHKARVATRRLRSDLKTFRPIVERAWSEPLRAELKWLGGLLGHVRDADVLSELLTAGLDELPGAQRAAGTGLTDRLHTARGHDRDALLEAMRSPRYARLLEWLVAGANDPRLRAKVESKRADAIVDRLTAPPRKKLARHVRQLGSPPTNEELHDVRKKAKQARYALEAVAPISGNRTVAKRLADLQDVLGHHQDAVVATAWLLDASRDAEAGSDEVFVAGMLAGLMIHERTRARRRWRKAWKRAR
jgi:CHAD domain-containing protein